MPKRLTAQEKIWRTVPERDVIRGVLGYCQLRGGYAYRQNTGGATFRNKGSNKEYFVQFGEKGASDVIAVMPGSSYRNGVADVLFIECKTETGTQSDEQVAWQAEIESRGGTYIVARPSNFRQVIDEALQIVGVGSAAQQQEVNDGSHP